MGMRLSPRDLVSMRRDVSSISKPQRIEVHNLSVTACTTCTAGDISCTSCGGDSLVSVDSVGYVSGRVLWLEPGYLRMAPGGLLAGGEMGDVQIISDYKHLALFEAIREGDGYLVVDGKNIRPFAVTVKRVSKETSVDVRANIVGEVFSG